jgi:predicted dehydrogenase
VRQLIAANKQIFCEKPLATNYDKAMEMVEAVEAAGLINMVNLTYRNVAELHKARELIASGTIGEVKHIEASYLQHWLALRDFNDAANLSGRWLWRLSTGHGSNGTLGDIGIHILDFTTFAISQPIVSMNCRLQTFQKLPGDRIGEYVLDANDSFIISAEFGNGAIGTIHSSRWASGHSNDQRLRVYGNKGGLELSHGHWGSLLRVCAGADVANSTWREVTAEPVQTNYQRFAAAVRAGRQEVSDTLPDFRRAASLQQVLDLALVADRDRKEHKL